MNASARAFLGISHSPLIGLNPVAQEISEDLSQALKRVREAVTKWAPDRVVLIGPDHYNGFFNEMMPAFCIGTQASAIGDYSTPAGDLNVDADGALSLANRLMDHHFDIAVSRQMRVDHGFSQPLQMLWGGLATPPVIPVFVNAVAEPTIPRLGRCKALGEAVGQWLDTVAGRTLLIGSGGLSHEPPVPTLDHPDPAVRERITVRSEPNEAALQAKTKRIMAAGKALADGDGTIKPLAPTWDANWMNAIETGDLARLTAMSEQEISETAGLSAHESKNWLIARAALRDSDAGHCVLRYYRAIPEYIAGFGILMLQDASTAC